MENAKNLCVGLRVNTRTGLNGTFSSQNPLSEFRQFLETELLFDKLTRSEDILKMTQLINLFSDILCEKLCRLYNAYVIYRAKEQGVFQEQHNFYNKKYCNITAIWEFWISWELALW